VSRKRRRNPRTRGPFNRIQIPQALWAAVEGTPPGDRVSPAATATLKVPSPDVLEQAPSDEKPARVPELAQRNKILDEFARDFEAAGVVGEPRAAKLLYLILSSRFLERPISGVIKGPSSAGKSRLVQEVLTFFPNEAYYEWSAMSAKALAYDDEPLQHRYIVLYEATSLKKHRFRVLDAVFT